MDAAVPHRRPQEGGRAIVRRTFFTVSVLPVPRSSSFVHESSRGTLCQSFKYPTPRTTRMNGHSPFAQFLATMPVMERLNKFLAHAGVGSRRHCEELIVRGRVTVDGRVVRELGTKVDAERRRVRRRPAAARRKARLLAGQQAARLPLHQPRPGRPAARHRPGAARQPARLHRRPARRGQRGAAAADQRRRPGQPADAPALRRREDVSRAGGRPARPRGHAAAAQGRLAQRWPRQGAGASSG